MSFKFIVHSICWKAKKYSVALIICIGTTKYYVQLALKCYTYATILNINIIKIKSIVNNKD